jgi:hypothetical protein
MIHFDSKFIYFISPVFTLKMSDLMHRSDEASWYVSYVPRVNLATTDINLLQRIYEVTKHARWPAKLKQIAPAIWFVPATHQHSKNWRPTLTQVPHCQLAGFEQSSWPFHGMDAFILVKSNESHVILYNTLHFCKPSAPGSTPNGRTFLDLTYGGRNCLLLRFLAPSPTKEIQDYFKSN